MTMMNDEQFEQWLGRTLSGRPEPDPCRDLCRRAVARGGATRAIALHRRFAARTAMAAAILIAIALGAGIMLLAAPVKALWLQSVVASTDTTSALDQLSSGVQWMVLGAGMLVACVMILSIWRMLSPDEGYFSTPAV